MDVGCWSSVLWRCATRADLSQLASCALEAAQLSSRQGGFEGWCKASTRELEFVENG